MNNILTYNDKSVTMKRKIIDYIVMSEYLIILEDFTGDDYNLVYCFDNELQIYWSKTASVCGHHNNQRVDSR